MIRMISFKVFLAEIKKLHQNVYRNYFIYVNGVVLLHASSDHRSKCLDIACRELEYRVVSVC